MKKIVSVLFAAALAVSAFAYNPPVQGENLFFLSHPEMISGGNSCAGGALMSITPASTTINPALSAMEERITLDLGYTMMFNSATSKVTYGQAFGTGVIIPTDWANFAGEVEGIFVPFHNMHLGNSINFKFSAAKQILDKLYIGVGLGVGGFWGYGTDWSLGADIGAVYNLGDLGFLKNFRLGASVTNLGKPYSAANVYGIGGKDNWLTFPCFSTIRVGAAAEFINIDNFSLGLSFDVTTLCFQNFIIDSGIQMEIANIVRIYSSWQFNYKEYKYGCNSWLPTLGLVCRFNIGTGFLKKNDWSQSEISPSAAWKNVGYDINMASVGCVVRLGELDTAGPEIEMN